MLLLDDPGEGGVVNGVVVDATEKARVIGNGVGKGRERRTGGVGMVGRIEVGGVTPLHRVMERKVGGDERERGEEETGMGGKGRIPLPSRRLELAGEAEESRMAPSLGTSHRKSRYSTLAPEIDEALGLLNRELEQAAQLKVAMAEMRERLGVAEQERRIWKGRAELLVRERGLGKYGNEEGEGEVQRLRGENLRLGEVVERLREEAVRKEREWKEWRGSMRKLVDGDK